MDFLFMFENPLLAGEIVSYNIVEVKRDEFNEDAKSYSDDVVQYVSQRKRIENKPIKLLSNASTRDYAGAILD